MGAIQQVLASIGGAGGGGGPYRYWRIAMTDNGGVDYFSLAQFFLFSETGGGGTRINAGATGAASDYLNAGLYSASAAFDTGADFQKTEWISSGLADCWLSCDLGSPQTPLSYNVGTQQSITHRTPTEWTVEASTDNVSWTVIDTRTGQAPAAVETANVYDLPAY